jgi:hypothetical protein
MQVIEERKCLNTTINILNKNHKSNYEEKLSNQNNGKN